MTRPPTVLLLSAGLFAMSPLLAGPPEPATVATWASDQEPFGTVEPGAPLLASHDCAARGVVDRDGAQYRRAVARVTEVVSASRRESLAGEAPESGAGNGIVGSGGGIPVAKVRGMARVNFVDDEIFATMEAARVTPAPLATDAEFLRRVTLDLTGRIPDLEAVKLYVADTAADKRAKVVDQLLASEAFNDRWALYFDDLFRNTFNADSGKLGFAGRNKFHEFFVTSLRSKKPYDVMVRELLVASGQSDLVGQSNFSVRNIQMNGPRQDTLDNLASDAGSALLGVNIFCTSCHSGAGHTDSINLWLSTVKRSQFWGMSAFFSRLQMRRQGEQPNYYYVVADLPNGEYLLNTTTGNKTTRDATWADGQSVIYPRYLLGGGGVQSGETYRQALARLVTADPQLARAMVNRLWKELFTVGIVEPADDFDLLRQDPDTPPPAPWTVQPTHPKLLTRLADELSKGYDIRSVLRLMAVSNAYGLSSFYTAEWKEEYAPFFARHYARRLRAEETFDAITKATNVPAQLTVNGYSVPVAWAGQLPDTTEPAGRLAGNVRLFLDTFLRGDRDGNPRSGQGSISQALTILNDRIVTERVRSGTVGSTTNKLVVAKASPEDSVDTLYLATLSRYPSTSEKSKAVALLKSLKTGQTTATVTEDIQFALINKLDFLFCY